MQLTTVYTTTVATASTPSPVKSNMPSPRISEGTPLEKKSLDAPFSGRTSLRVNEIAEEESAHQNTVHMYVHEQTYITG